MSEARAEVEKAAELCEFACSLPQIATDKVLKVGRGVEYRHLDVRMRRSAVPGSVRVGRSFGD